MHTQLILFFNFNTFGLHLLLAKCYHVSVVPARVQAARVICDRFYCQAISISGMEYDSCR